MEDEFFGQVFLASPDDPTNTSIYKSILMATDIDTFHQWQPEIPLDFWVKEWCNKSTTCCIHMNWCIPPAKNINSMLMKSFKLHLIQSNPSAYPVSLFFSTKRSFKRFTSSNSPFRVDPKMAATQIVFSSTISTAFSGSIT